MIYLFESKIATRDQINRDVFGLTTRQTLNSRLRKLVKAKLVRRRSYFFYEKLASCYEPTDKALKVIQPAYKHQISKGLIKSDSVVHDLGLVELKAIFKRRTAVSNFVSENILQSCGEFTQSNKFFHFVALNCDGVMEIKKPTRNHLVAVEYESTDRSASRYRAKVTEYYVNPIHAVFYVCRNKIIESILKKVEREIYEKKKLTPKFYYCRSENVQSHFQKITFVCQDGDEVTI